MYIMPMNCVLKMVNFFLYILLEFLKNEIEKEKKKAGKLYGILLAFIPLSLTWLKGVKLPV